MLNFDRKKMYIGVAVLILIGVVAGVMNGLKKPGVSLNAVSQGSAGLSAPSFVGAPLALKRVAYEESAYDSAGAPAPAMMPYPEPPQTAGETAAEVDQKIIKNGYLRLVVDDVDASADKVSSMAERRGGFVQNSSVTERPDGTKEGSVTVRVPAAEFEAAMSETKALANLVRNENKSGQDVTEQYTDLQAQLRNAKAQEETYLAILKQAKTVEDTLLVQDRLAQVRGVIESLEGRLKYLSNVTSYSTINVTLEEEAAVRAPTKEFRLGAIVKEAVQTLVNVFQQLVVGLVWFVIVWGGVLLPVGLLAWLGYRVWKRRQAPKR
jgi:hypothetical protein